jgi:hypothetical protein
LNTILTLPTDLKSVIGTENIDFSILAKRKHPLIKSWGMIGFGVIWSAFISLFVIAFIVPIFKGEEVQFKVNDVPASGSIENFDSLVFPVLLISVFVIVGIAILISGIYSLFQKGGHYVATENRLIHYHNGTIKSYDWEQFSGNMELNNEKGDISLELRTGKMVSRKDKPDEYVPDILYISGITSVLETEIICRKRIREHDPTPAAIQNTQNLGFKQDIF